MRLGVFAREFIIEGYTEAPLSEMHHTFYILAFFKHTEAYIVPVRICCEKIKLEKDYGIN